MISHSTLNSLVILAITACSSTGPDAAPPAPETETRVYSPGGGGVLLHNEPGFGSRLVPASIDSVWSALPRVFEILDIPDVQEDLAQRAFGNSGYRARRIEGDRLSKYIDCGTGATAVPNADQYEVTLSVITRLSQTDDGTLATTTVHASARPRAETRNPVPCQSKGVLEERLAELIMYVIVGGK